MKTDLAKNFSPASREALFEFFFPASTTVSWLPQFVGSCSVSDRRRFLLQIKCWNSAIPYYSLQCVQNLIQVEVFLNHYSICCCVPLYRKQQKICVVSIRDQMPNYEVYLWALLYSPLLQKINLWNFSYFRLFFFLR